MYNLNGQTMPSLDFEPLTVIKREYLTADILSLHLQRPSKSALPAYKAGAHIYIQISDQLCRAYSLCGDPAQRSHYEIAVKLDPYGQGGSKALHQIATPNATLQVSAPYNMFELVDHAPHHLLVGGGIGLTPLIAMAYQLSREDTPFSFYIASSNEIDMPFRQLLDQKSWPVELCTSPRKLLDVASRLKTLPTGTHVYCCGPTGLINSVRDQCSDVPLAHWHEERFNADEPVSTTAYELYLSESDRLLHVKPGSSLLSAVREAGIHVESACEQGICGSCVVPWCDGDPVHGDQCLDDEERAEYIALCCGSCRSDRLTLEL
ncbi:PDR/VanB family oxidoreductase [Halomonas sp. PAMB 3264]|uniref:PDR/VanB family oxidoreductase n=1 Tax=Halomonas sp. PAMB 3264 TaxID=3075222 RepID=UPI002898F72C|nr:PDR/VanB family oxidoreductase [Halomonas sp. PAMB 3264]WNL41637.1 PDR/VanB family oxidoreductase [Halomonas sp. PAMB 3264]